jgi:hypothetical protein
MRRWAVGLAGLVVLVLAAPAQAKGEASDVMVSQGGSGGPGGTGGSGTNGSGGSGGAVASDSLVILTKPIHLTGLEAAPWLSDSGVFQNVHSRPPTHALGPSLNVRMAYTCGNRGGVLFQRLYPYARGGAIVHTMSGQSFCDGPLPATWWRLAAGSKAFLESHGLPETMPLQAGSAGGAAGESAAGESASGGQRGAAASGAGNESSTASSGGGVPVLPVVLGIAALGVVLGAVQWKRRTIAA